MVKNITFKLQQMSTQTPTNRGLSQYLSVELERDPHGNVFAIKRPNYGCDAEDLDTTGFDYFDQNIGNHPFLRERFPRTKRGRDQKGIFFRQSWVRPNIGQENMAHPNNPADFDPEQFQDPQDVKDVLMIIRSTLKLFRGSLEDPKSGLEKGYGWYPEVSHPDSFVRGKYNGNVSDRIYIVDCNPFLPLELNEANLATSKVVERVSSIALNNFGIGVEKMVPDLIIA